MQAEDPCAAARDEQPPAVLPIPLKRSGARNPAPGRRRAWPLALALSIVVLLASPGRLIGESERAEAARQRRTAIIEAWLASRAANLDGHLSGQLARSVVAASERNALDPVLLLAIIQVESRFDHKAVSPRGAQGLMQVKPVVINALIEKGKIHPSQRRNLKDPFVNVRVGASYLAYLNEMFGDLRVALTAYNWGPTRIREIIKSDQKLPMAYAFKVLTIQRELEAQLALQFPGPREAASAG